MMNRYRFLLPLTLYVALAVTACSSANKDWANASAAEYRCGLSVLPGQACW